MSTYKNLARSGNEYARVLPGTDGGFRGVDLTSAPNRVATYRLADCQNMYRDYRSAEGGALETIPGFRCIKSFGGTINGVHHWRDAAGIDHLVVHAGTQLYIAGEMDRDNTEAWTEVIGTVADSPSKVFCYNGFFYILDGVTYQRLTLDDNGGVRLTPVSALAYVPTLRLNGEEYEQRNMLTNQMLARDLEASEPPVASRNDYGSMGAGKFYAGRDSFVVSYWGEPDYYCNTAAEFIVFQGSNIYDSGKIGYKYCEVANSHVKGIAVIADENTYVGENACGCYEGLTSIYLSIKGDAKIGPTGGELQAGTGCKVFYNFAKSAFADAFCDSLSGENGVANALMYLPPNVVLRPGETVILDNNFTVLSAKSTLYSSGEIRVSSVGKTDKVTITSVDGKLAVVAGSGVASGRYYYYGTLYDSNYIEELCLLRIEVSTEEQLPHTAEDVFEYDAYPQKLFLPVSASEIVSVTDGVREIAYGCYRNQEGMIEAVGVMAPTSGDVTVTAVASSYHFSTAAGEPLTSQEAVNGCKLCAVFDNRVFLTGHPALPNTVFYSMADDPTYFGVLNYFNEGGGFERITALLPFSDTLAVCKADKLYYRTGADGDSNLLPRVYVGKQGALGLGCLGACCNFLDDPVFLTKEGVWGLNKADVTLERSLGRRSGNIDPRLLNEAELAKAEMVEWEGYLCLFVNGNVYMADSRAVFTDATGNAQYEWFYLTDVGVWKDVVTSGEAITYVRHHIYATATGDVELEGVVLKNLGLAPGGYPLAVTHEEMRFLASEVKSEQIDPDEDGEPITLLYAVQDGFAYPVYATDEYENAGELRPAVHPLVVEDRLYFGNADGDLYVFNNDKRGVAVNGEAVEPSEIHRSFYSFDGHRIEAGFLTKEDDCDVPHLTKSTSHRSLTVRVKLMTGGAFTMSVYTERRPTYTGAEDVAAGPHSFYDIDFSNASFFTTKNTVIVGREHEKRWVEKQYLFRDGGFQKPFGVYGMVYRYRIAGRIREQ